MNIKYYNQAVKDTSYYKRHLKKFLHLIPLYDVKITKKIYNLYSLWWYSIYRIREVSLLYNHNIGLVIEGGGMRGSYTAGVLDAFMDENIKYPYVIGVSAGANNGCSFVSEQRGRSKRINLDWSKDKRFLGFINILREGSYFGMNFLFDTLPNELEPFDYETFYNSKVVFKVGVTQCETGRPVYFKPEGFPPYYFVNKVLRASSSIPIISKTVEINGQKYLDGGIADPIPIEKSIEDGNTYNVIILTRNEDYTKHTKKLDCLLTNIFLCRYPKLVETIKRRAEKYNNCLKRINMLEKNGSAYVFRPKKQLVVNSLEKDSSKLKALYEQGYNETIDQMNEFREWINGVKKDSIKSEIYLTGIR